MSKRTELLLIAAGFSLIATVLSGVSLLFLERLGSPLRLLWIFAHLPASIAYIGTIAEHDPLKGGSFLFFAFIQWTAIGLGLGWVTATVRRSMHK